MNSKHNKRVIEMGLKPKIIGLDRIVLSTCEGNLLNADGSLIGAPDNLMFDPSTKTLYQIEYKSNNSVKQANKAKYQLKRNGVILQSMFGEWRVVDLYVHSAYEVERL